MSNNTKISAAPVSAVPVGAPVASAEPAKNYSFAYRLLALLSLVLCAGVLVLDVNVFTSVWGTTTQSIALDTLKTLFASEVKAFGILPVLLSGEGTLILIANLLLYVLLLTVAVSAILSIIGLICGKSGVVRTALAFVTWGALIYALGIYFITSMKGNAVLDVFVVAFAAGGIVLTFIAKLFNLGKAAWLWLLHFVLAVAAAGVAVIALNKLESFELMNIVALVMAALMLVNAVVTFCRSSMGVVRTVAQFIFAVVLVVLHFILKVKADNLFLIIAAIVALAQLVIVVLLALGPREKDEEPLEAPMADFRKEEYIEAYPYDGGPVAGVELAEEVNPTLASINAANNPDMAAQATVASLLGNGFDPFLITLSEKEKEDFIDLYVLKCKGIMPEIPGYVVGGDNKEFFNCVFIYLGQYREKIPAGLLAKMYKFSMKI